jgi:hypothetical protein
VEKAENIGTFGVVGFKYDGNWRDYDIKDVDDIDGDGNKDEVIGNTLKPNVFYEDGNTTPVTVETVSVDGTQTCTYAPLQGWSNSKKYAFFAFYPMPNGNNVKLVNLNRDDYTGGVPAIKYTMAAPEPSTDEGPADGAAFKASMVDLMIAAPYMDLYWKSSTDNSFVKDEDENNNTSGALGEVNFEFSHKLSALGVSLKKTSASDIQITNLALTISGIKSSSTIIPLNGDSQIYDNEEIPEAQFELNTEGSTVGENAKEINDKLIFVPQSDEITISISIKYNRKYPDSDEYEDETIITGLTTDLVEGSKYILQLNFVDYSVEVSVSKNDWVRKDIGYNFY